MINNEYKRTDQSIKGAFWILVVASVITGIYKGSFLAVFEYFFYFSIGSIFVGVPVLLLISYIRDWWKGTRTDTTPNRDDRHDAMGEY